MIPASLPTSLSTQWRPWSAASAPNTSTPAGPGSTSTPAASPGSSAPSRVRSVMNSQFLYKGLLDILYIVNLFLNGTTEVFEVDDDDDDNIKEVVNDNVFFQLVSSTRLFS